MRRVYGTIREDATALARIIHESCGRGKGILVRNIEAVLSDKEMRIIWDCGDGYGAVPTVALLFRIGDADVYGWGGGRVEKEAGYPLGQPASSPVDITCWPDRIL